MKYFQASSTYGAVPNGSLHKWGICKIENAETECICFYLCIGSPGDGGTCSQEFPGPGELQLHIHGAFTDSAE